MTGFTIDVRDLKKSFGARKVVDGLTLQVGRSEICGFLGANGSGKTTTIRMLCGLLAPDGGSGTCLGHEIIREASLIRREAGYMTQKFSFYEDLTVFENLDLVARVYDVPNRRERIRIVMAFSVRRFTALLRKEWLQMWHDAITLRFIIALPMLQLFLFGYAINTNPKHLPAGLLSVEHSKYERTLAAALRNSGYYDISMLASEAEAERGLAEGKLLFVINIPPNFDRSVDRGETPSILVDADATDPAAIVNATAALAALSTALDRDLPPVRQPQAPAPPFQFVLHARYNPEQLTVLNIVPGLICIVLLISTLLVTALSITRERERGTMENLLAMPVRPIEVMLAKIMPYVFVGYIQVVLILTVSTLVFQLPIRGSVALLLVALGLFIASNLALGITFSTVAANQMQAIQFARFTLLPSLLLSGCLFPFKGMPVWAQLAGEIIPATHAMRVVRGLLLKGNRLPEILPELWPIALFALAAIMIAVWFYRETLD